MYRAPRMTMPAPPGGYGPPGMPLPVPQPTVAGAPVGAAPPGGHAPAMASIPPPPPRQQKSRAAGIALGGVVTLLVVGGGAMGFLLCTGGKKFDTRVPLEKAPPVTVAAMGGPAHGDLAPSDAATKEATASALAARFCGGVDIVGELFAARYRDAASAAASLSALRDPVSVTDSLKCGKALAEAMEGRSVVQLGLLDGTAPRRVAAIKHKAPLAPFVGFVEKSFGAMLGRCAPPRQGEKAAAGSPCAETGAAGFDDNGTYYGGRADDVTFFANAYRNNGGSAAAGEPSATLAELAKKLDPADSWELRFRPEAIDLALPCVAVAPADGVGELVRMCLPAGHENDGQSIAADVKASAVLRERPENQKAVGFEYVLWARDSESAKDAETKLNAYADALGKTAAQNEQALLKIIASGKDPRDAMARAVAGTWLSALKKPEVRASGDVVRLLVKKPLREDDKAQVKALLLATSEDVQKAGVIVDALIDAKSPPADVVGHFLGADLAAWLLAPDAKVDDCKQIAKHANDMSNAPDFPSDQFLPMTELIESWGGAVPENEKEQIKIDDKSCSQRRLTPEAKACLLAAKTIGDMAKCPTPTSPDTATFKARIQGKWRAGSLAGASTGSTSDAWGGQKLADKARGSSFVVEGSKVELTGGYDEMRGDLGFVYVRNHLVPELGGEATIARIKVGQRRAELIFAGDKLYLATWDQSGKKKPAVLLERVTGER